MPYRDNQKKPDPPSPREPDLLAFPLDELERRYRRGWPLTARVDNETFAITLALCASLAWTAAVWDLGMIATARTIPVRGLVYGAIDAVLIGLVCCFTTGPIFYCLAVGLFRLSKDTTVGGAVASLLAHLAALTAFASVDIARSWPLNGKFGAAAACVPALLAPILGTWLLARAIAAAVQRARAPAVSVFLDAQNAFETDAVYPAAYRIRRLNGCRWIREPRLPHVERFYDIRKWAGSRGADHATLQRAKDHLNRLVAEAGTLFHDNTRCHLDGLPPVKDPAICTSKAQYNEIYSILGPYRQLAVLFSKSKSADERRGLLQRAERLRAELREALPPLLASVERAEAAARDLCAVTLPAEDSDGERRST